MQVQVDVTDEREVVRSINLDNDALPKRLLQEWLSTPSAKGLIPAYSQLLTQPPKLESWKSSTRKLLNFKTYLSLMDDCTDLHIGACSIPIGRPARHWSVTLGDTNATRRTNQNPPAHWL